MQCPVDNTTLVMSDRQGIEIDYCPQCRGVWLDRGEIDKIVERSTGGQAPSQHAAPRQPEHRDNYEHDNNKKYYDDDDHGHGHQKRHKESWLGDLFD